MDLSLESRCSGESYSAARPWSMTSTLSLSMMVFSLQAWWWCTHSIQFVKHQIHTHTKPNRTERILNRKKARKQESNRSAHRSQNKIYKYKRRRGREGGGGGRGEERICSLACGRL